MKQYVEQKQRVGDAVLLFRMGDFYETFYDDAVLCARVLGIALTSRNKGENPIPLAGIPYHALDSYLKRLVQAGHRVAISEQMEDPRQAKGVVRRDVVRIVSAGTLTEDALLPPAEDNLLAALWMNPSQVGCVIVELTAGRIEVLDTTPDAVFDDLTRARPAELLIDDERNGPAAVWASRLRDVCGTSITRRPAHEFSAFQAHQTLLDHFGVASLDGFGFDRADPSVRAAGCAIQYLRETQCGRVDQVTVLTRRRSADQVQIDQNTWRSLEVERSLRDGSVEGTLYRAIDRTVHPHGGRRLRRWLQFPLTDLTAITARQDAVHWLVRETETRRRLREGLRACADVERIAGRTALGRASPRDLAVLARTLVDAPAMMLPLESCPATLLHECPESTRGLEALASLLLRAFRADAPPTPRDGDFLADGFDPELDRLRAIGRNGNAWLSAFQKQESERTGVPALKVGYNRVFGYYIEVSRTHRGALPADYVRRQTVKNAERYITDRLMTHEAEMKEAQEQARAREQHLFEELCERVRERVVALRAMADVLATLDVIAGLAELAAQRRYVRPCFVDGSVLEVRDGRHPVLDQTLGDRFVPNDTTLDEQARLLVLTGPNMAGKSTYIRQVALLTLMAHAGSFVPARSMTLSVVDRLFARVGSTDEIAWGRSTFMVEMTEAAFILRHATRQSLVILDELGRGTSTFDGLALARAVTEHLVDPIGCRTLVATHYHELTELADRTPGVRNYHVAVRAFDDATGGDEGVVFLYRIREGGAGKSYGIHVARLAGVPQPVVCRAREVLDDLQRRSSQGPEAEPVGEVTDRAGAQLSLFAEPMDALVEEVRSLDPDRMTPLEALHRLMDWKKRLGVSDGD